MIQWIFSGLNVNVYRCRLDSIGITVEPCQFNNTEYLIKERKITIDNSSFGNLDLKSGTQAQITHCFIDTELIPRPTLITANNSEVLIQNCHFGNFINENGSTVLFGHNNSHVTIKNSVFIQHNSSKGVILLRNSSSLHISSSSISQNIATSPGYSSITLYDGINAVVNSTVFTNNSGLTGGAMIVYEQCKVTLTNCTCLQTKPSQEKHSTFLKTSNQK